MKLHGLRTETNSLVISILCGVLGLYAGFASGTNEIDELVGIAMVHNPRIRAARCRLEQALLKQGERSGFFDPQLTAAAGLSSSARSVPGVTAGMTVPAHATVFNLSLEAPVPPGFYLGFGLSERFFSQAGDADEELYQTLAGVRIRIPLLRDRGFRQYDAGRAQDVALMNQAAALLMGEMQSVIHELELLYIAARRAAAMRAITHTATLRFEVLMHEAEKLVELGVTPSYQVLPAEMELNLRRSEENEASQAYDTSLVSLTRVLGVEGEYSVSGDAVSLIKWAGAVGIDSNVACETAFAARGSYQALLSAIDFTEAQAEEADDDLRSDISIEVGSTWQGENHDDLLGNQLILSDEHLGSEAMVVLRRPLGYRVERNKIKGIRSRIAELEEKVTELELEIRAGLTSSLTEFSKAGERLEIVSRAVKSAEETVSAERQRFRLGEGRSRNVLDAQKDLTGAVRRQAEIAVEVLKAYSDFRFTSGLNVGQFDAIQEIRETGGGKRP